MNGRAFVFALVWSLAALILLPAVTSASPWTPADWQQSGKFRGWVRDANNNYVDDLIERVSGDMTVIVDLNQCVGDIEKSEIASFISARGDITYTGRFLTFLVVKGIDAKEAKEIAAEPEVAAVEISQTGKWDWDEFKAAKVRNSSEYSNNLQSNFGWPTTPDGSGVNVALLDNGVGAVWDAWFVNGFNALNYPVTVGNPPPEAAGYDHANYMAEIIFGGTYAMAPGAGLIDIKIGGPSGPDGAAYVRALEEIYARYDDWNINVISCSGSFGEAADGRETYNQLIDMLAGRGVVFVGVSGSNAPGGPVVTPGAATRAIAVNAADINGTVSRGNDTAPLTRGPRADDGDLDQLDELKPEVCFPMGDYWLATNSTATAATAGLVALAMSYNSDLRDFDNKAAGSLKDLLIRSAEAKGGADTTVAYPQAAATWNDQWGFGEIDAFTAFSNLSNGSQGGIADLTFLGFDGSGHPSTPHYHSHAVETQSGRLGENVTSFVPDTIYARLYNNGPGAANNVRVSFGFYPWTAGIPTFYDIGSKVVSIPASADQVVSIDWTPPGLSAGEDHGCILVTIDYGYDTDFSNKSNFAQKNVRIERTGSPATFTFRVENPLPARATMTLKAINNNRDWKFTLSETSFVMETSDCAREVQATAEPGASVKEGADVLFYVTLYARPYGKEKEVEVGGVALRAINEKADDGGSTIKPLPGGIGIIDRITLPSDLSIIPGLTRR